MKSFLSLLESLNPEDKLNYTELKGLVKTKTFDKGTILQNQGEFSGSVFFVKSGMLRSYTIDSKGKEHIFMFAPEGWLMSDGTSDTTPNELFIDVLEKTEVEVVEQGAFLEKLMPLTNNSSENSTTSMGKRISVLQKRIIMLMSASAIERYEHFIETYPEIIQRVPQKMIASYLGITPEALSKVKGIRLRS